jgi:hypothetical protein
VRRNSAIDLAKQKERIERARKMTPEARMVACINMSRVVMEIHRAGERHRQAVRQTPTHED